MARSRLAAAWARASPTGVEHRAEAPLEQRDRRHPRSIARLFDDGYVDHRRRASRVWPSGYILPSTPSQESGTVGLQFSFDNSYARLPERLFDDPAAFDEWAVRWQSRLADEARDPTEIRREMESVNPAYIPRNHLVEEVIEAAVDEGDLAPFEELLEVLASPFDDQRGRERFAAPPRPDQVVERTFCGT